MISISKLCLPTRAFLNLRICASVPSATFASLEEKAGLPPKPKRPLTPYFRFLKDIRPQISKQNPKLSVTDIIKECSKKWAAVAESEKQKYTAEFEKDKESYLMQRAKYDSQLTEDQRYDLECAKQDRIEMRQKRAFKKKVREMGRPKKPASSFLLYMNERLPTYNKANANYRDFFMKVTGEWKDLSPEQKQKYNDAAKSGTEKYRQELAQWELKMIRLGNTDIVRQEALLESEKKATKTRSQPNKPRKSKHDSSDSD